MGRSLTYYKNVSYLRWHIYFYFVKRIMGINSFLAKFLKVWPRSQRYAITLKISSNYANGSKDMN